MRRRLARISAAIAAGVVAVTSSALAAAHQVGLSRGDYALGGDVVTAELTFARGELTSLLPELDANGDGRLAPEEVEAGRAKLEAAIVGRIVVTANGATCPGKLASARLTEEDGVAVRGVFRCSGAPASAHVELPLLEDLAHGHRHVARARGEKGETEDVLYRGRTSFEVPKGTASGADVAPSDPVAPTPSTSPSSVALGFTSFARDYLHAAFLVAALAIAASRRARIEIAAAFGAGTIGGLLSSTLGVFTPDPRALAPAIAVSVAYAGITGFFAKTERGSWATALAFGTIHGFGAASAVARGGATTRSVFGVILATLVVGAALVALGTWASRGEKTRAWAPRVACAAVALVGLVATARSLA